jgi:hypothetical protein
MKKLILLCLMLTIVGIGVSSCNGCAKGEPKGAPSIQPVSKAQTDYDGVVQDFTAGVEHVQALHRQTMFSLIDGQEYQWRNSKVLFNDTITLENIDNLHVVEVTDVFFYWDSAVGPQVQFIATNVKKGTLIPPTIQDVWIEDANLSDKQIKLTVKDVLNRLKEWNGIIPPGVSMSLRYPVGPCECNAQWVIGDEFDVIFIDAVTGDISNWCPAFNPNNKAKGGDFGKPLGEWP